MDLIKRVTKWAPRTATSHMNMEQQGHYYGYPECCIIAFLRFEHMFDPDALSRPLIGTGFVPCKACSESHSAEELMGGINKRRQHPTPLREYRNGVSRESRIASLEQENRNE